MPSPPRSRPRARVRCRTGTRRGAKTAASASCRTANGCTRVARSAAPELVKLFASLLRREPDGSHVVVTPVEKLTVEVEDAPFVAVEVATEGTHAARHLAFRLNTDDVVVAGPAHPITLVGVRPYLQVRHDLMARIERAVFYELADLALSEDAHGLYSDGRFFALA